MDDRQRFIHDTVRDALLQRLLKGRAREVEALPELLREFGICFRSEQFADGYRRRSRISTGLPGIF